MRPAVFAAHERMLPQLQAEEALAHIAQVAVGTGSMEERDQRSYLGSLRRAASGGKGPGVMKATTASLALMGIKVTTVEKGGEDTSQSSSGPPNLNSTPT